MQTVAAGWLIYGLTHSALAVGALTACSRGPAIVLSTYGGTLADRYDRRRLTIALYGVQAVPAGLLAVLAWAETPSPLEIYALTLVIGVAGALASPPLQDLVTATVPSKLAGSATALSSASFNVARLIGPAAAGVLVAVAGPAPCFALNAASFLVVVLSAATLPGQAGKSPGVVASMESVVSRVRSQPLLRTIFPVMLLFSFLVAPVQELAPAIAHRFGGGAHLLGFLLSALAVGGLISIPTRSLLKRRGVSTADAFGASMVLAAVSLVVLAASPNFTVAAFAMVLCGIALDVVFILGLTGVQLADKRMTGVLTGLFFAATVGGVTIGALFVGGVFDAVGMEWGLAACAFVIALGGLGMLGAPRMGRVRAAIGTPAAAVGVAVVSLALVTGCGGAADTQNAADSAAVPAQNAGDTAAAVPPPVSRMSDEEASDEETSDEETSGDQTGDEPDEASPPPAPQPRSRAAASRRLDDATFWRLIAETRSAAGNDTSRQSELLTERLKQLAPQAIVEFARTRHRLDQRAYTWKLWGAAYVIEDGCSDDCFRDFRGYIISLGRGPYERALVNPDSLASVAQDAETGNWENADNVAPDAYSSVTGGDFPLDDTDLSGRPRGTPFNENNGAALARRYPRLAARFR